VVGDLGAELGIPTHLFLRPKVWTTGRDAGVAHGAVAAGLLRRRLDLMQIHNLLDWRTHLRTSAGWKEAGRIRYLGVTHYAASAYDELERVLRSEPLDSCRSNYSLGERAATGASATRGRTRHRRAVNRPFSEGDLFGECAGDRSVVGRRVPTARAGPSSS